MSSGRRADDSSSSEEEDLSDLTPFQKVVHRDSYRRALQYPTQLDRYAGAAVRLDGIVDQMKLWVKNTATEYDPKREVQTFVVTVYPKTPIKELRATIFTTLGFKPPVTRFGEDSDDEEAAAAAAAADKDSAKVKKLKLVYRGLVLEDGKVFDDYEWKKERWKWSKPYAGVVWVSPFQPEPMHRSMRKPTA